MANFQDHKVTVNHLLGVIPESLLRQLSDLTKVYHYSNILQGRKMFYLLLYGILENDRLSQRTLEDTFNDSIFKTLFALDPQETVCRSSISERLGKIDSSYFRQIYECIYEQFSECYSDRERQQYNLNLSYNRLNLIEKVDQNSTTIANYSYLSDGTKLQAVDGSGNGLVYSGSLVYNKQGGNLTLESAAVAGGRIIATGNGYDMHYFLTDHLGSTRVVVNSLGAVVEQSNYYPFGSRWDDGQISDNRYLFNGKEAQAFVDVPYLDYGARQYDPLRGTWNGVDFLAEEDSSISPYAYCRNNPIGFIDPTGMSVQASGADSLKVVPINPVVVEARRNNTYSNPLLFIMWSAASWGQMWNNALGNSNASFSQNMYTGLNIWQSFALSWGISRIAGPYKLSSIKATRQIKISPKIQAQISRRGWTEVTIKNVIKAPCKISSATNRATNNKATAFFNNDGSYVVVDDITNEVVQISNKFDKNWVPDATIINPYQPK